MRTLLNHLWVHDLLSPGLVWSVRRLDFLSFLIFPSLTLPDSTATTPKWSSLSAASRKGSQPSRSMAVDGGSAEGLKLRNSPHPHGLLTSRDSPCYSRYNPHGYSLPLEDTFQHNLLRNCAVWVWETSVKKLTYMRRDTLFHQGLRLPAKIPSREDLASL